MITVAKTIEVRVSQVGLAARGLSLNDLITAIGKASVNTPSGALENTTQQLLVRAEAPIDSPADVAALDRGLAEKRIYPAIDIATSGTRREEKLFKPEQLDAVYTLRRGLQQMPPSSAMEWLIKRIASTPNNDALLAGL